MEVYSRLNSARDSSNSADPRQETLLDNSTKFKISVFGIGYVGTVSAACLARDGHEVVPGDVNQDKVDILNRGQSPIVQPGAGEGIHAVVHDGRLKATTDPLAAVPSTDISLV